MAMDTRAAPTSRKLIWAGRITSALPALVLLLSGVMKLVMPTEVADEMSRLGYDASLAYAIGILEIACTLIYLFPRTAVLGAILLTGYLGGAVATHVRVGDHFFTPLILGVFVWGGLYLRDARLAALLLWRK